MRRFYHHGLSFSDLYVNTPKKITEKNCRWFRNNKIASGGSLEDGLSAPFKYILGLIFSHIIEHQVRFIIPYASRAWIDFETINEEDFEIWRQNGGLQEIDFVESDFKGYILKYTHGTYKYQRSVRIYVGGELKKSFLGKINSGVKFYTTTDVTIKDFIKQVYAEFPLLTKYEIDKLLKQGFLRMNSAIKNGCAVSLKTTKWYNWVAYFGEIHLDPLKEFNLHARMMEKKLRKLDAWKRTPFDGYYYIPLHQKQFEEFVETNKKARTLLVFGKVMAKRLMEECIHRYNPAYIFRYEVKKFKGYHHWLTVKPLDKVVFMGYAIDRKFVPTEWTWKKLIKEYEKGNSELVQ